MIAEYFDLQSRLKNAEMFRQLYLQYCSAPHNDRPEIRSKINAVIPEAADTFNLLQQNIYAAPAPAPAIGGGQYQRVNIPSNVFNNYAEDVLGISPEIVIDQTERVVATLRYRLERLRRRMLNPFAWLGWIIGVIIGIPFRLLSVAGFDGGKAEGTTTGRLLRFIEVVGLFGGAVVGALHNWGIM